MKKCRCCPKMIEDRFVVCYRCFSEGKLAEVLIDDIFDKNRVKEVHESSHYSTGTKIPESIQAGAFMKKFDISWSN